MSNKRICDVCGSTITAPYIEISYVNEMWSLEGPLYDGPKDICNNCWDEFTKFIKKKREVEQ